MEYNNGTKYLQASAIWHQGPRSLFDKFLSQLLSQIFDMMRHFLTNTNISFAEKRLLANKSFLSSIFNYHGKKGLANLIHR